MTPPPTLELAFYDTDEEEQAERTRIAEAKAAAHMAACALRIQRRVRGRQARQLYKKKVSDRNFDLYGSKLLKDLTDSYVPFLKMAESGAVAKEVIQKKVRYRNSSVVCICIVRA